MDALTDGSVLFDSGLNIVCVFTSASETVGFSGIISYAYFFIIDNCRQLMININDFVMNPVKNHENHLINIIYQAHPWLNANNECCQNEISRFVFHHEPWLERRQ